MIFNTNIECNKNGTNINLKFHILSPEIMEKEGFNKYNDIFTLSKSIPIFSELEVYITYDVNDKDSLSIMVLDKDFCQPYDYQYFIGLALEKGVEPKKEYIEIKDFMENFILHLQEVGILSGYNKGDII